ncbi:MAG: hypothetical protein Q9225_006634 [Loekoesia sp. 1 TL-2023]
MVANERRILEQSKKRGSTFPHCVTRRASRWCRCFTKTADSEEREAQLLFELARTNTLAAAYNVNASSKHLEEEAKARKMVRPSVETIKVASRWHTEPSMCDVVKVDTYEGISPTRQELSQEVQKDGITITTTAILPSSSSTTVGSSLSTKSTSTHLSARTTDTEIRYCGSCGNFSIDKYQEHRDSDENAERELLVKWGKVEDKGIEVPRRRWWKRLSMRRR